MRKVKKVLFLLALCFMFVSPMVVKADLIHLNANAYSNYVSVGSEFIVLLDVGKNFFDGTVTFDSTNLELKSVKSSPNSQKYHTTGPDVGTVTHTVNGGKINIKFIPYNYEEYIYVTFKVNGYPSGGITTINAKANTSNWFGDINLKMNVIKPSECPSCPSCDKCPTCEKDEVKCPVCEECNVTNEVEKTPVDNNKETNSKDILLYGSLGACGALLVAVVVLVLKKK